MILTGSFKTPDQRELQYPLILEKNGILLAMLNYTYGTNNLAADTPNIVNYIDTITIQQDIRKAMLVAPDFMIACIHWGKEYQRQENAAQQALAGFLFEQGVDAVIGSHPHVVQPVRFGRKDSCYTRPVAYSLGNFISNQRNRYRNGGIIFGLELEKTDANAIPGPDQDRTWMTRITGLDYLPVYVHKPERDGKPGFILVPCGISGEMIGEIGFTGDELAGYREFCEDTRKHLSNIPQNRFFSGPVRHPR